jgi:sorbitol-specific phosphotransferase system component IIBC
MRYLQVVGVLIAEQIIEEGVDVHGAHPSLLVISKAQDDGYDKCHHKLKVDMSRQERLRAPLTCRGHSLDQVAKYNSSHIL